MLTVDDNPVNQLVAESMLLQLGCHVALASDGAGAITRVMTGAFHVVLMDTRMPGMDGLAATRAIRRLPDDRARVVVVGLTADASPEARAACLEAGMDDYLSKPYTIAQLGAVLQRARLRATPAAEVAGG